MKQERMYCRECKREWVEPRANYMNNKPCSITGNPIGGNNCPVCGSPELELVRYDSPFPGGDIPREGVNQVKLIQAPAEIIPGLVHMNSYSVKVHENWLLTGGAAKKEEPPEESRPPDYDIIDYGE